MLDFRWRNFDEFTATELYSVLSLRQEVFILEQECLYPDIDQKDSKAIHLMGYSQDELACYLRLFHVGVVYPDAASLGRVVTASAFRKQGYALLMMKTAIDLLKLNKTQMIQISAQTYLKKFYTDLGFKKFGKEYLEDGIPHISMHMDIG